MSPVQLSRREQGQYRQRPPTGVRDAVGQSICTDLGRKGDAIMRGFPLGSRIALAMKALMSPFDPESARAAYGMLNGILHTTRGSLPDRSTEALLQTFNTSPWVRACAGRVADAMAAVEWKLYVAHAPTGQLRHDVRHIQKAGYQVRRKAL